MERFTKWCNAQGHKEEIFDGLFRFYCARNTGNSNFSVKLICSGIIILYNAFLAGSSQFSTFSIRKNIFQSFLSPCRDENEYGFLKLIFYCNYNRFQFSL